MKLFERRIKAEVDGRQIEVVNHWFKGCAILVDGVEVARTDQMLAIDENTPLLEVSIDGQAGPLHLDVRMLAVLYVQMELRVNGHHVTGSRLVKEDEA